MKLYYLNHGVSATEWNNTDTAVCDTAKGLYEELKKWATGEPFAPQGFSHMLIHYPDYQDKFFKKENLSQCIENNSVIFFMSSVGVSFQPFCHDYVCDDAKKEVRIGYVFGIKKNGQHVITNEWESLFTWAKALYEALTKPDANITVEKIVEDMPTDIKALLCASKSYSHLIALSILCQGYLAAHGDDDSINKLSDELKRGVQDLIKGLPDGLKKTVQTEDNKNKTKGKSWWTSALGDDDSKIQGELEAVQNGEEYKTKVQNLITAIYTNSDPMPDGNLVAKAYSALKSIL